MAAAHSSSQPQPRQLLQLVVTTALLLLHSAQGYPMYWHNRGLANSCTDAPTTPVGRHQMPVADT